MSRDRSYRDKSKYARVTLGARSVDTQLAFVDRACSLMSESRYAPNRTWQLMTTLTDRPETQGVFFDLTDEGPLPSYPIANVLNCFTRIDMALGLSVASRWLIRDAALAEMRSATVRSSLARGPT